MDWNLNPEIQYMFPQTNTLVLSTKEAPHSLGGIDSQIVSGIAMTLTAFVSIVRCTALFSTIRLFDDIHFCFLSSVSVGFTFIFLNDLFFCTLQVVFIGCKKQ